MSVNNISFILHKPQLSENIGACARGMKNFNFKKLVIVDPKPIFPNDKIISSNLNNDTKEVAKKMNLVQHIYNSQASSVSTYARQCVEVICKQLLGKDAKSVLDDNIKKIPVSKWFSPTFI